MRHCFVLMPFAPEFDGVWKHVIRHSAESAGYSCSRADDFFGPGVIMADIESSIRSADVLVADLTGRNANVYYELGLAHAVGKPVILIAQRGEKLPFDIAHQRVLLYENSVAGAKELETGLASSFGAIGGT